MNKFVALTVCFLMLALWVVTAHGAAGEDRKISNESMTNARLEQILRKLEPSVNGEKGRWQFTRDGMPLMVLTDESHNRMRVMAPAANVKQIGQQELIKMMEANFLTALDARYAVFKGVVWAVFIHPLDSLQEKDFISAVKQVVRLAETTGTTYSSSELQFGSSIEEN